MAKYIIPHIIPAASDFVPEVFGRLTTLGPGYPVQVGNYRKTYQMVRCECGVEKPVIRSCMKYGAIKSCGCLNRERVSATHIKHGHAAAYSSTPEYRAYRAMLARCYQKNHQEYHRYGAKGIGAYSEWRGPGGFERWLAHIGLKPSPEMTQDRFPDRDGNYEPGNVRWATIKEQNNNTNRNVHLTYLGKTQNMTQWAEELGMSNRTLRWRINAGWTDFDALATPVGHKRKPRYAD